jgi:hypothetical protein
MKQKRASRAGRRCPLDRSETELLRTRERLDLRARLCWGADRKCDELQLLELVSSGPVGEKRPRRSSSRSLVEAQRDEHSAVVARRPRCCRRQRGALPARVSYPDRTRSYTKRCVFSLESPCAFARISPRPAVIAIARDGARWRDGRFPCCSGGCCHASLPPSQYNGLSRTLPLRTLPPQLSAVETGTKSTPLGVGSGRWSGASPGRMVGATFSERAVRIEARSTWSAPQTSLPRHARP